MNEKKVVLVGVHDVIGSTNIPMAISFIRAGYDIIPINYRTIIRKYGLDYFYGLLLYTVKKYKPVLTLFSKCNGISSEVVRSCNDHTTTFLWNMDPIQTIKQCPEVIDHAKLAHFSSCTSPTVAEWFEKQGVEKCHFILEGFDSDVEGPDVPEEKYKAQVSFIGTKTETRDHFLDILDKNNIDAKFYGDGYGPKVHDKEFSKVCSSSDFMLSINTYEIPNYCSNRIIRYAGCGSCILHYDPNNNNLGNLFSKDEVIIFRNDKELIGKINNTDLQARRQYTINAREKALSNYTYDHTIHKILEVANVV
jgi:hypothetical protein